MAFDFTTLHEDIAGILQDSTHIKWTAEEILLSARQALGEISMAAGQLLTVDGIDGETVTTVPDGLQSAMVSGGCGFCAAIRVGARADWESQAEGEPARLASWGSIRLAEFRRQVSAQYPNDARTHTQRATSTPWGKWADDFGEVGKDDLS